MKYISAVYNILLSALLEYPWSSPSLSVDMCMHQTPNSCTPALLPSAPVPGLASHVRGKLAALVSCYRSLRGFLFHLSPCAATCGAAGHERAAPAASTRCWLHARVQTALLEHYIITLHSVLNVDADQRCFKALPLVVLEAVACARPLICIHVKTAALHRGHVLVQERSLACKSRISYRLLARLFASRRSTRFGGFQHGAQLTTW